MKELDWEILLNHFNGETSAEEERSLNSWIQFSKENKKEYDLLKKIWNNPESKFPQPDTQLALKIVKERLRLERISERDHTSKIYNIKSETEKKSIYQIVFSGQFIRAAAILIVILGAVFSLINLTNSVKMIEVEVNYSDIQKISLSDGSIVTLDAGTILKYPEVFNENTREVYLSGEGYFEVSPNIKKPFIVHANNAVITVLGTKFNISAWETNNRVDVAVTEGKVSLHSEGSKGKDKVLLTIGQKSTLKENGIPTKPEYADVNEIASWLKHEKYFNNTPVYEIINQVERWYNVKLVFPEDFDYQVRVSIHIRNLPVEDVLDLFSALMNLGYTRDMNTISFKKR